MSDVIDELEMAIGSSDYHHMLGTKKTCEMAREEIIALRSRLEKVSLALGEMSESLIKSDFRLGRIVALVNEQAEDDGLWFQAATAPEGYLQQELRKLHAAIEGVTPEACAAKVVETPAPFEAVLSCSVEGCGTQLRITSDKSFKLDEGPWTCPTHDRPQFSASVVERRALLSDDIPVVNVKAGPDTLLPE